MPLLTPTRPSVRGPRPLAASTMLAVSAATGLMLAATASPALAQHDMHAGHGGMTMEGGWRMVPMDPNMPMLPGLADAVPIVGPFMPGMGMDPAMLPEAGPSEVVELADRDTLDISVSMVRRTIAGHEMIMFGYN